MTIAAIETTYAGHRFRSRLEARWAVFFDAYDIRWLYEPQGYDIGGVWYLPDFWLPALSTWVEVKGRFAQHGWALLCKAIWTLPANPDDLPVGGGLVRTTPSLLVLGEIPRLEDASRACHTVIEWGLGPDRVPTPTFQQVAFRAPTYLMQFGPTFDARSMTEPDGFLESASNHHLAEKPDLAKAFDRARRARFEHGETP